MRSALFWSITQRRMVILYRRFGTTCRSHLQRSRSARRLLYPRRWDRYVDPKRQDCHSTLRNTPEERRSQTVPMFKHKWKVRFTLQLLYACRKKPWMFLKEWVAQWAQQPKWMWRINTSKTLENVKSFKQPSTRNVNYFQIYYILRILKIDWLNEWINK
jgi:hypothetical protein